MTDTTETERNRRLALDAFERFAKGDIKVLRTVLSEDFVEHSPGNPSGRDAFIEFIAASPLASAELDLKRVLADGPYVAFHYRATFPGNPDGLAVVDLWRVEDGKLVEHWDVVQPVPDPEQVPNGMF